MTDFKYTENQLAWLAALESGEYEQTKGRLREGDAFCCLGVACDVSGLGEWECTNNYPSSKYLKNNITMPGSVVRWLGIKNDLGYPGRGFSHLHPLYKLNDTGYSFKQIADHIREQPFAYLNEKK